MEPNISFVARLLGEPARAAMLMALMSGKALTATELAEEANITAQTASSHLSKLLGGELIQVRKQGRHKYFQLKDGDVAALLEQLLVLSSLRQYPKVQTGPKDVRLRYARVCYNHLAGETGVALYDALLHKGYLNDDNYEAALTDEGRLFFQSLGMDVDSAANKKRPLCKSCLDWSERRSHLAGTVAQWLLDDLFEKGWATRDLGSRAIRFSADGLQRFKAVYQLTETAV